jgi:RNA polymerase-binding transcription factor DksA
MAKASKKSAPKKAKKVASKAKSVKKAKSSKGKAAPKKASKPKAAKKAPAKKVAKKKVATRAAVAKPVKVVKEKKRTEKVASAAESRKAELPNLNIQLTVFPIQNQRPIAHKQAKTSEVKDDKTRYSEEELKEFESLINQKLNKARDEFKILKDTLNRANDEGTDSTSGGNTKVLEDGAETAEKENLSQLAARQLKYITNLENALVRIKNGTYGICSVTGKLIPKERLIAVPHTTQSIEAKMMKKD